MKLKVALFLGYPAHLNNQVFNPNSPVNRDNCCYKWQFLRQFLFKRGIELQTYDVFERRRERPDFYFFINFSRESLLYILRRKIRRHQILLWAYETQIALNNILSYRRFMWIFLEKFPTFPQIVLTHNKQFIDGKRFRRLLIPQPFFSSHRTFGELGKKLFSAMIYTNKVSRSKGELFSLRREIIRFFEKHHPDSLDVYGVGWNKPLTIFEKLFPSRMFYTSLYRGACASKLEILANYKFTFCIQNHQYPNDIDEKIFDALFAGSVPIYYGAPNILEYIPEDCFIDFGKFQNLDNLFTFMEEVASSDKLQRMKECGWEFLNSERFTPFRVETFCETIYKALIDLADRNY